MIPVVLEWSEASFAQLTAPKGEILIALACESLSRTFHEEEGRLVVYSRPAGSLEEAQRAVHAYAKAWLARHTSVEEVYGSEETVPE